MQSKCTKKSKHFSKGRGFHLNLLGVSKSAPTIMHFKINHVVAISIKGTPSVSELAFLVMQDRVSLKIMLVKAKRAWLISSCRVSATHYKTGGCVVTLRSGVMLHGETKLWLRTDLSPNDGGCHRAKQHKALGELRGTKLPSEGSLYGESQIAAIRWASVGILLAVLLTHAMLTNDVGSTSYCSSVKRNCIESTLQLKIPQESVNDTA